MIKSSDDSCALRKSTLLKAAKKNPASIWRLARYLRLSLTTDSVEQTARFIRWFLKKEEHEH